MDTNVLEVCSNCFGRIRKVPIELLLLFVLTSLLGFVCLVYTFVFIVAPEPREPIPSEKHYKTLSENGEVIKPQQLPCWHDIHIRKGDRRKQLPNSPQVAEIEKAELFMSVVVPAYNEEERLGGMLEEAVDYLENAYGTLGLKDEKIPQQNGKVHRRTANGQPNGVNGHGREAESSSKGWEILIVSDGSTDKTVDTALAFARDHQLSQHLKARSGPWTSQSKDAVHIPPGSIRVVSLSQNRGKGGAVTHGMKHVRGAYVVFADADGASKFEDLGKLVKACRGIEDQEFRGIAIGSRAHLVGSEAVIKRSRLRNFLMHSFHIILRLLTPPATAVVRDTQCGFKLFSRSTLPHIIPYMHCEGWIFDVEMLMLAEFAGIPVAEVPVGWREVKGSKLNVIWDSLGMAWGLAILRAAWGFGIYRKT